MKDERTDDDYFDPLKRVDDAALNTPPLRTCYTLEGGLVEWIGI